MITSGNPGMPRISASALPSAWNSSVEKVATAMPCFSSLMASWIHHDVQEPQSAKAAATTWQRLRNSWVKTAGTLAVLPNHSNSMPS